MDALLRLHGVTMQMLYCYEECSILSFFLFHVPTYHCACFFTMETSAIDLKLQHMVENGPSSNRNIFLEIRPTVPELEKSTRHRYLLQE